MPLDSFQAGLAMIDKLSLRSLILNSNAEYDPTQGSLTEEILENIRNEVTVMKVPTFKPFSYTFSHVFGGSMPLATTAISGRGFSS